MFVDSETDVLVTDENDATVNSDSDYFELVNRGGLSVPSEHVFSFCSISWMMYNLITKNDHLCKLLHSPNLSSRAIFALVVLKFIKNCDKMSHFLHITCANGHLLSEKFMSLTPRFFNLFSKNFVSVKNSEIQRAKKRSSLPTETKRDAVKSKVAKLQSDRSI